MLIECPALMQFDPGLPIVVVVDSSSYGIGAVLSHVLHGIERPVCFASRTLAVAERSYSQLGKEALALTFGIRKFHNYLWETDEFYPYYKLQAFVGIFFK